MNHWQVVLPILVLFGWMSLAHSADSTSRSVCWPLNFAGITLGVTTDAEVQRLLGKGVVYEEPPAMDSRYFIDSKRSASLHVVSYTDEVVGEVTLLVGIDPGIHPNERKLAVTKWFNPDDGFGNWHALRLGSSKEEVIKNLGKPKEMTGVNQWTYYTKCACEIPESFRLFFKNRRLYKIVLSAPPG